MRNHFRLSIVLTLALVVASGCVANAKLTGTASAVPELTLIRFTIEPQPLDGLPPPDPRSALGLLLEEEATGQAERSLLRRGVTGLVQRDRPGVARAIERYAVQGTVRIPLSLPAGLHGLRADGRKGILATAIVSLVDPEGEVVAESEATLEWHEVRWLTGGPKGRRSRPAEQALAEGVRESVDRAIRKLPYAT